MSKLNEKYLANWDHFVLPYIKSKDYESAKYEALKLIVQLTEELGYEKLKSFFNKNVPQENDYFGQAKAADPNGNISSWAQKAQELKDAASKPQTEEAPAERFSAQQIQELKQMGMSDSEIESLNNQTSGKSVEEEPEASVSQKQSVRDLEPTNAISDAKVSQSGNKITITSPDTKAHRIEMVRDGDTVRVTGINAPGKGQALYDTAIGNRTHYHLSCGIPADILLSKPPTKAYKLGLDKIICFEQDTPENRKKT